MLNDFNIFEMLNDFKQKSFTAHDGKSSETISGQMALRLSSSLKYSAVISENQRRFHFRIAAVLEARESHSV